MTTTKEMPLLKRLFTLACALLSFTSVSIAQHDTTWTQWHWLMGEWVGEGSGVPGEGGGSFSLHPDLENFVLVRRSQADYPASGKKPAIHHGDLMIIYPGEDGQRARAIYFDNEGHVIEYAVTLASGTIVFTSGKTPRAPAFRLTYVSLGAGTIRVTFSISRDGVTFVTYTEGTCRRKK